jgi:transposase-like protein
VPAGDDRRPRRRVEGAHRGRRRVRESSESWADLLRDCKRRGMRAPVLAVGDGALGFWKALREVFPDTKEQRCWFHVQANVLAALPKSAHPGTKAALAEIYNAEDKDHAVRADYGAKWPKATAKITDHLEVPSTRVGHIDPEVGVWWVERHGHLRHR